MLDYSRWEEKCDADRILTKAINSSGQCCDEAPSRRMRAEFAYSIVPTQRKIG